ncbi:hypothetical protein LTR62_000815 [Meristemomyces frigidus]|uniref:Defects in morphology protein 1 n=1 Tax=Meristemomyces frigidus TaxID=1508187 RepID=A0AAN7YSS2_9PEZI|nr:hypothetical protein LTR62_000815 [Meristemomyces frigidus]
MRGYMAKVRVKAQDIPVAAAVHPPASIADGSDYGSDLDEATVDALFSQHSESQTESQAVAVTINDIEAPTILDDNDNGSGSNDQPPLARLAKIRENLHAAIAGLDDVSRSLRREGEGAARKADSRWVEIEYDERNRVSFSPPPDPAAADERKRQQDEPKGQVENVDTRSPLLRFRTPPKKCLSVTDLTSPAWCELQYSYNLSKYGRVKRTKAMKQGSSVHKKLEEQVHTEVPVEVVSKEDRFGLRLWNVIEGIRTIRRTGMTREIEVWGVVEGEVVNGVIDLITTSCPDREAEARMMGEHEAKGEDKEGRRTTMGPQKGLREDQRTPKEYYLSPSQQTSSAPEQQHSTPWLGTLQETPATQPVYIVDVKTRQSASLPAQGSQTRPIKYQLMLYHHLLHELASNNVPAEHIFARYDVDPHATFSDTFLAQMSALGMANSPADDGAEGQIQDPLDQLLAHNTLSTLWTLMIHEFALFLTPPTPKTTNPSPLSLFLTAEFRLATTGHPLGKHHFLFSASELATYISEEMQWWRGERAARGVEVEEAFKCRICTFASNCEWRVQRVEEGVRRARLRRERGGGRSEV